MYRFSGGEDHLGLGFAHTEGYSGPDSGVEIHGIAGLWPETTAFRIIRENSRHKTILVRESQIVDLEPINVLTLCFRSASNL